MVWDHVQNTIQAFLNATRTQDPDPAELESVETRLSEVFALLDNVERMDTGFYGQVGLSGRTKTF